MSDEPWKNVWPKGAKLWHKPHHKTLDSLLELVREIEQHYEQTGFKRAERWLMDAEINRFEEQSGRIIGLVELTTFLNTKLGKHISVQAIEELFGLLSRKLNKPFSDVEIMTVAEAARILDPPALGSSPTNTKGKRGKPGDATDRIIAALQTLASKGDWNASESRIIATAGVAKSTYYSVLDRVELVQKARELYGSKRLGRGPVHVDDL